jgi:hypothetical protein
MQRQPHLVRILLLGMATQLRVQTHTLTPGWMGTINHHLHVSSGPP